MYLNAHVVSHPGKVREKNEDNFYFCGTILEDINDAVECGAEYMTNQPILFGVYDGMGGISSGEKASRIASDTTRKVFMGIGEDTIDFEQLLLDVCQSANDAICFEMIEKVKKRMGSTAAMLLFYDEYYTLCNIGDSPIFLLRNGQIEKLSKDHNERENYEKIYGPVVENEKFKLTQHLGIFQEEMIIEPYIISGRSMPNDRFLICSDGLTDMVSTNEIESVLCESLPASATTRKLQELALDGGGKDNITVVCIDLFD